MAKELGYKLYVKQNGRKYKISLYDTKVGNLAVRCPDGTVGYPYTSEVPDGITEFDYDEWGDQGQTSPLFFRTNDKKTNVAYIKEPWAVRPLDFTVDTFTWKNGGSSWSLTYCLALGNGSNVFDKGYCRLYFDGRKNDSPLEDICIRFHDTSNGWRTMPWPSYYTLTIRGISGEAKFKLDGSFREHGQWGNYDVVSFPKTWTPQTLCLTTRTWVIKGSNF